MSFIKNKTNLLLIIGILLLIPLYLFAQEVPLEVAYPELGDGVQPTQENSLVSYINYAYNFLLFIAALILFGALIYGGFLYLTAGANASKTKKARKMLFSVLIGIVLAFSAHLILNTINPQITKIDLGDLTTLPGGEEDPETPDIKKSDLKAHAMALDSAVEEAVGKDSHLPRIKKLITEDLKNHINATFTVDTEIGGEEGIRKGIASFAKYNHYLTTKCSCENLKGHCGPPSRTANCAEPSSKSCKSAEGFEDEDGGPDPCPENIREEIDNKLIDLANFINNEGPTNNPDLTEFQTDLETLFNKIESERLELQNKMSAFETMEYSLTAAEWQKNIDTRSQFLDRINIMLNPEVDSGSVTKYESEREIIEVLPSALSDQKFTPLTFYELFYSEIDPPFREKLLVDSLPSKINRDQKLALSNKVKIGQLMDKVRENNIVMLGKMEEITNLIEEMQGQIKEVAEGVSKCNDSDCEVSCNCVPNPWSWWTGKMCLTCVGGCQGSACSGAKSDLIETSKELKETETKLLKEINEFKMAADKAPFYLKNTEDSPFETLNLQDVKNKAIQCQSKPGWGLISCEKALGHGLEDEEGKIVTSCHPRDYYCARTKGVEEIEEPKFTKLYSPGYLSDYSTSSSNACPEDWQCSQEVKNLNQFKDASVPLQRFLTCLRENLDKKKKEKEIEDINIATIVNISDPSLYKSSAVCTWDKGGKDCNYPFVQELFKERVSAYYGGERCHSHIKKSYAVQLKYDPSRLDLILDASNSCLGASNIKLSPPYLNISIAGAYRCGVE